METKFKNGYKIKCIKDFKSFCNGKEKSIFINNTTYEVKLNTGIPCIQIRDNGEGYTFFDDKMDCYFEIVGISENIIINKDNISLYYEFMSFDDILINIELLNSVLFDRYFYILIHFKEIGFICENKNVYKSLRDWEQIQFKNKHIKRDGYKYYEISFFDIKDTLKPINEYIEEIKQSEAYKEYIAKKS